MPAIRLVNGLLFDPWNPEAYNNQWPLRHTNWDWLGHHLANECRYAGGCRWFYSVAQHSVLASRYVDYHLKDWLPHEANDHVKRRKIKLAALVHDSPEAVLKDLPSPIKHSHTRLSSGYCAVENKLQVWFYEQFDILEYLNAPQIKAIDKELLDAERHVLFSGESGYSGSIRVEPWDREYARDEFKRTLLDLTR